MTKAKEIIEHLRADGFRLTVARKAIIEVLCESRIPLSVTELISGVEAHSAAVDRTTVYRELSFLHRRKIIRQIDLLEGMKRYEVLYDDGHHHHAVCTTCGYIECVEMENDLVEIEKKLEQRFSFKVSGHSLEFFGLCRRCQGPQASNPQQKEHEKR